MPQANFDLFGVEDEGFAICSISYMWGDMKYGLVTNVFYFADSMSSFKCVC